MREETAIYQNSQATSDTAERPLRYKNIAKYYRKIHYLTREFRVKWHAKTDIARIAEG